MIFRALSRSVLRSSSGVRTAVSGNGASLVRAYHERVHDHYENPRNVGTLDKNDPNVGTGLVGAPACGDVMRLQIKVDDNGKIVDVKFKTFGCGSAIASSSYASEMVKGMKLDEAKNIRNTDIAKDLCLPPVKLHCSMLAEDAIKSAINDYRKKKSLQARPN
ncbi:Iron-sulfur cluster assembly enzyme ISCU, mitochondrial [Zancudomyces culisetae]|uniref:Iron-sulfur cluster assembly protein n=1 Tax=Zancudomyces culisetae TaxID=1213189 RepID=A0A1R1PZA7_ZANCU|nr:Iron-sulfur cluster assembly enzyme ISCU, mitochondrial [Zancudomyces culisetae]|eukprot:OMH86274.1 Iron-sulfur cluster assembly enzyme ISCU, mitochondrial [Zancudomyces culisetae]